MKIQTQTETCGEVKLERSYCQVTLFKVREQITKTEWRERRALEIALSTMRAWSKIMARVREKITGTMTKVNISDDKLK
jgi:predicted secreted protein